MESALTAGASPGSKSGGSFVAGAKVMGIRRFPGSDFGLPETGMPKGLSIFAQPGPSAPKRRRRTRQLPPGPSRRHRLLRMPAAVEPRVRQRKL